MRKVDTPLINLIVKVPGKIVYINSQHIRSFDEVIEVIKSYSDLAQFITDDTILLGDDKQTLNSQHLVAAQESGNLNITLSYPVIDTGYEVYRENLERAFNITYVDNNGMVNKFLTYLNRKHRTWKDNTRNYVPYSTIFQSSGYGKSRLVKEVAKKIPTIYLCLRDTNSTGYPPRTNVGADLFERVLGDLKEGEEYKFLYVLQIAIQCFREELVNCNNNNEELWNSQMSTEFCGRVWTKIQTESGNWRNVFHDDLNKSVSFLTDDTTNNDVCFLFCIDEVRVLISPNDEQSISPFRILRRALREIKWNGFFVLLLDTLSKISNFAPPKSTDSSSRDTSALPLKLFYPYFRLTTMDIFKSDTYNNESWNLAKFGRPLYISYLQSCNNDPQAIDKLKNLLKRKLLGGANSFENSKREISSLAILSSVIGLDISPQFQLASELVASHMATCLSVSEDRERLIIAYPSEPLLSEVALEFMSDSMLPKILGQFSTLLKKGIVEPGPRGELVSRIILAVVAHKLSVSGSNSVRSFLRELYHDSSLPDNMESFSKEFLNGTVSFTHFNAITHVPIKEDLEKFYMRRCAFIMKRNHPGADICIPVKLTTNEYSIIVIQIKNYASAKSDKKYPASGTSKLNCGYVFEGSDLKDHNKPCICLYWQLGYKHHYQESLELPKTRSGNLITDNLYWATFGLTHYKIDNDIIGILKDMLSSYISPFESEWKVNNEKEGDIWNGDEIKIMHPLSYGKYEYEEKEEKSKKKKK